MSLHLVSVPRCNSWHRWILEDAPVQELHDVECSPYDARIITQAIRLGHRNVRMFQGMYDSILPLDLVRRFRQQFSWRLFAQYILAAVGRI